MSENFIGDHSTNRSEDYSNFNPSRQESDELGFDWKVVTYFRMNDADLLRRMWSTNSEIFETILNNTIHALDLIETEHAGKQPLEQLEIQALSRMRDYRAL